MHLRREKLWLYLAMSMSSLGANATSIVYNDFSSVAGLQLNGDAAQSGSVLRLTPAVVSRSGSVFSTSAVTLGSNVSFSTYFQFRISNVPGSFGDADGPGADGLAFVVQTVSNTAGGGGGGIGYAGLPNSVGIEFDTYNNGAVNNDPDGNHVGIDLSGNIASISTTSEPTRFNDGQIWNAWVDYNGATNQLDVRWSLGSVRPLSAQLSNNTVNLLTVLGTPNAYVGFTSGTGLGFGNHDILRWEFRDTFSPIDPPNGRVPEPSTLLLLGAVAAGVSVVRHKRRD